MSVSIDRQINCAKRELSMRLGVYPRWVANGRMSQEKADDEIAAMEAIIETLEEVEARVIDLAG